MYWMIATTLSIVGFFVGPFLPTSDWLGVRGSIRGRERGSCRTCEVYRSGYTEERAFWGYGGNLSGPCYTS